jgi:hypothetical protein
VLPEIKATLANTNIRFFVIDNVEKEEQLGPNLAEGHIKAPIVAVGPTAQVSSGFVRRQASAAMTMRPGHGSRASGNTSPTLPMVP